MELTTDKLVEISGAGPAGLAAAISSRKSGCPARIYEKRKDVGFRFHGDFQGLENWTTDLDILDELDGLGIAPDFDHRPFYELTCFLPYGDVREYRSSRPLFYLIHRGNRAGSLDLALKQQALDAGADIRFGEKPKRFPTGGVVCQGPHRADAIAAGYLFDTDMADAAYVAVSDQLAPKGYAYLLVWNGRATLASCLFEDFHNERMYVERCLELFKSEVGVHMDNPRSFGGSGNFSLPATACKGNILYAGESAGFQDPLFGFGMRWALLSGAEAGRALADGRPEQYDSFWKRRLRPSFQTATTNRWIYAHLGDRGYRALLGNIGEGRDACDWMRWVYNPNWAKRLWYHVAARKLYSPLLIIDSECDCTWCRCQRHAAAV